MVTIIKFYAYGNLITQNYYKGESWQQIHLDLHLKCPTYVVCEILKGTIENQPLTHLTNLKIGE